MKLQEFGHWKMVKSSDSSQTRSSFTFAFLHNSLIMILIYLNMLDSLSPCMYSKQCLEDLFCQILVFWLLSNFLLPKCFSGCKLYNIISGVQGVFDVEYKEAYVYITCYKFFKWIQSIKYFGSNQTLTYL